MGEDLVLAVISLFLLCSVTIMAGVVRSLWRDGSRPWRP